MEKYTKDCEGFPHDATRFRGSFSWPVVRKTFENKEEECRMLTLERT